MDYFIHIVSSILRLVTSALLVWLFTDALILRLEPKTALKACGFFLLFLGLVIPVFSTLFTSLALLCVFLSFALDSHLWFSTPLLLSLILVFGVSRNFTWLLTAQSMAVFISIFNLAYTTKHRDLIPFGLAFILTTIAFLFTALQPYSRENFVTSQALLHLFAQLAFLYWWWSYVAIRFSISSLGPRLKVT